MQWNKNEKKARYKDYVVHSLPSFLFLSSSSSSCFSSCQQSRAYTNSTHVHSVVHMPAMSLIPACHFYVYGYWCAEWASPVGLLVTAKTHRLERTQHYTDSRQQAKSSLCQHGHRRLEEAMGFLLKAKMLSGQKEKRKKISLQLVILWESHVGLKSSLDLYSFHSVFIATSFLSPNECLPPKRVCKFPRGRKTAVKNRTKPQSSKWKKAPVHLSFQLRCSDILHNHRNHTPGCFVPNKLWKSLT